MQYHFNDKALKLAKEHNTTDLYFHLQMGRGNCCSVPRMTIRVGEKPNGRRLYKELPAESSPEGIKIHYESGMDLYTFDRPIEVTTFGVGKLKTFFVFDDVNVYGGTFAHAGE